jgi:hypothetical protein
VEVVVVMALVVADGTVLVEVEEMTLVEVVVVMI